MPQATCATAKAPTSATSNLSSRPAANGKHTATPFSPVRLENNTVAQSFTSSTLRASSQPAGSPAKTVPSMPMMAPPLMAGKSSSTSGPGTWAHEPQPGSCYGIGLAKGSLGGAPHTAYGASFIQPPGGASLGFAEGSMYGGQNSSIVYGFGHGASTMNSLGSTMGSMYGMGGLMGSMYGMGGPMGSMRSTGGGGYGMSGYGASGFHGSLYGGSLLGTTGNLYGAGGSLYESNNPQAAMGSMYGIHMGSMLGGFGSIYQVDGPHTGLGVVRKQSIPGFSYSFGSNLVNVAYRRSFNADSESSPRSSSTRDNSFHSTTSMKSSGYEAQPKGKDEETIRQRGLTGVDKDGMTNLEKLKGDTQAAVSTATAKPESIMKHAPVTEAPKSPTTARQLCSGDAVGQAPVLSSDFRIHSVAVLEQAGVGNATVTKQGDACVVKGKVYAMDEVVEYKPAGNKHVVQSRHLNDLIEHVLAGHNSALLVADDGKAVTAAKVTVEATMTKLIEELKNPARNSYAGLSMSMCSLPSNMTVCDLLKSGSKTMPLKTGNSPLFGPSVVGLKPEPIGSGADFAMLYDAALKRGDNEPMMVCMVVVRQVRRAVGEGKGEIFLSSVFIGVSRFGPKAFHNIIDKLPGSAHEIFRYAIDGPAVCVHIVAVSQDTADTKVLEAASKVSAVQNSAARSGNVRRFIDFTESQLKSMLKRRDASTGTEKAELDSNVKRLNVVLQDAKKLLSDPQSTVPHVYQAEVEMITETTPTEGKTCATPEAAAASEAKDKPAPAVDYKPCSTSVATLVISDVAETRAYSVKGTTVTAGGRPFSVDEVVMRDTEKSVGVATMTTSRVLAAFLKGYNGAIVAADSAAVAANGMESPAVSLLFSAVVGALGNPGCKGVRVSIALVRESGVACDLTGSATELKPIEVSSSPLFGPILRNVALHLICESEELQTIVDKAREQVKALWDAHSAVHMTVLHCFTEGDDAYVSSLLLSFAPATCKMHEEVLKHKAQRMYDLFRYAFGGAATTAFVVSVGKTDQVVDVVSPLSTQCAASVVRNRSPRQGSIKNFIEYTKTSLDKRRERLATLSDASAEKATTLKIMAPMERMLSDHERVMVDPANNFPQAYAAENGSSKEASGEAPAAAGAARPKGDGSPAESGRRDLPSGQQLQQSPQKSATANATSSHPEEPISSFTEPRVVAFVGREVAAGADQLSLGSKDYTLDEMVKRVKSSCGTTTGPSVNLTEIEMRFAGVHNCSLISASSVKDTLSAEEPVWMHFQQCLNKALATGKPGEEVRVDLIFTIVSADELMADLLSDEEKAEPKQLEIVSSPICGPRIQNTCTVAAHSSEELARLMDKVHARADRHLNAIRSGDLMMVGTALLRRRTNEGDVLVASLMGTLTGPSVKAYKEAMEKTSVARCTLLSCAYGGPSATVTVLNVGAEDESVQGMLSTAISISKKQRNLVSRAGSVQAFLRYTEGTMKREQAHAAAASGEAKEGHLRKVSRLQPVTEDHKKLLQDFMAPIPAYPTTRTISSNTSKKEEEGATVPGKSPASATTLSESRRTPQSTKTLTPSQAKKKELTGPNRIQTVVVVTLNRKTPSSTNLVSVTCADETHMRVQIAGEQRVVECDEAVGRLDHTSTVRSDKLSSVAQQFVGGFNTAVLCCDVGGSNAGPTACVKTVHHAIEAKPEGSELFMSISAVKDDENAKDLLASNGSSDYAPLKVSNSPIFGPWVHEATMAHLVDVAQFDGAFSAAYAEATKDGAVCIVSLVLKTMVEGDVIMNSLLVSLSTQLNAHGAVVNAPLKTDRKLYQYAVHGSCFSVGLLGLPDKVNEEGFAECLELYATMRTIENRPMRNGSVRRFLAYSISAAADAKSRAERVTDERQRAVYAQRLASLEKMARDARALIESPEGQIPKTYM
uniref:Present in the outer mitochondrial membrane proteome 22 n=1 Tax=Leishmania guyanensis TaxID=5670 RepID=A0A1E1J589_LEIGU|nr:hypothetical protein, conserved [Leishmania guyanensis]